MKFYCFFHILLILLCITVYTVVCFVCFYLILYITSNHSFVMFMYSYCYVCSVLGIVFHCVVLCIVCVYMCTVLMPPGVNPIAVNKYIVSYHIMSCINYHIISYLLSVLHLPLSLTCSVSYWATVMETNKREYIFIRVIMQLHQRELHMQLLVYWIHRLQV